MKSYDTILVCQNDYTRGDLMRTYSRSNIKKLHLQISPAYISPAVDVN